MTFFLLCTRHIVLVIRYLGIWKQLSSYPEGYVAVVISSNDGCAVEICREFIIQYSEVFAVAGTSNTVHLQRASLLSLIRILAAVCIRSVVTVGINEQEQNKTPA